MTQYSKVFIAGANGMLGTTLQELTNTSEYLLTDLDTEGGMPYCDIRDLKHTTDTVLKYKPDVILNFAALVDLEYCEQEKDDCYLTNTIAAVHLFNLAKDLNIPYVFISTAGIFGNDKEFYTEEDTPYPLSAYGKSKYYTEQLLQNQGYEKYWIFRAGWMMGGGPSKDKKFVWRNLNTIQHIQVHALQNTNGGALNLTSLDCLTQFIDKLKEIFIGCDIITDPLKTYLIIDWS